MNGSDLRKKVLGKGRITQEGNEWESPLSNVNESSGATTTWEKNGFRGAAVVNMC